LSSPGKNTQADTVAAGTIPAPGLAPHTKGFLQLPLPEGWQEADVLYVRVFDPYGREINIRSWPLQSPAKAAGSFIARHNQQVSAAVSGDTVIVNNGPERYYFSSATGQLIQVTTGKGKISLSGGPVLAGVPQTLKAFAHHADSGGYVISARYEGKGFLQVKWTFRPGVPAQMDYSYSVKGETSFTGITFRYPEEKVKGLAWIGEGPYRVWKNRLQGQQFGSWHKAYNNTVTGESWIYPEFKGYHANVYQATFETTEQPFTFYTDRAGVFLQVFHPEAPKGAGNNNTAPAFPEGDIGFLSAISPIGTKFQDAAQMGPESQQNVGLNYMPVSGSIRIAIGDSPDPLQN
jgi:hypothetical protein